MSSTDFAQAAVDKEYGSCESSGHRTLDDAYFDGEVKKFQAPRPEVVRDGIHNIGHFELKSSRRLLDKVPDVTEALTEVLKTVSTEPSSGLTTDDHGELAILEIRLTNLAVLGMTDSLTKQVTRIESVSNGIWESVAKTKNDKFMGVVAANIITILREADELMHVTEGRQGSINDYKITTGFIGTLIKNNSTELLVPAPSDFRYYVAWTHPFSFHPDMQDAFIRMLRHGSIKEVDRALFAADRCLDAAQTEPEVRDTLREPCVALMNEIMHLDRNPHISEEDLNVLCEVNEVNEDINNPLILKRKDESILVRALRVCRGFMELYN